MTSMNKMVRSALIAGVGLAVTGVGVANASPYYGHNGHSTKGPEVHLTAPIGGEALAPGIGKPGHGSLTEGSGFVITVEAISQGRTGIAVKEGLNIRHTELLGGANPNFPGLDVTVDNDLTKPDGGLIKAGTNLAPLFNVAGTDDSAGPGSTAWASWHVLESLKPGTKKLTLTAKVTDQAGRTGVTKRTYSVTSAAGKSGQALTPRPGTVAAGKSRNYGRGPGIEFTSPVGLSSVAKGTLPQPTLDNGSLFFIGLDINGIKEHTISVNENADGAGQIVDGSQIGAKGPNRNIPGLNFTFDAPLRQPNGNLVPAGQNLAPLFNTAGSSIGRDGTVSTSLGWVVGGSIEIPKGKKTLLMTAKITDDQGATKTVRKLVLMSSVTSGQDLTPAP